MFVFGLDLPIPEILFIVMVLLTVALIFILVQMRNISYHIRILESTTLEIRNAEEAETQTVRRFETDMQKLESDEAELFVTKIVPTVSKLENYVAVELMKGRDPEEIKANIVKKGISPELATKVVNSMTYYLDFFQKLPDQNVTKHISTVEGMKIQK